MKKQVLIYTTAAILSVSMAVSGCGLSSSEKSSASQAEAAYDTAEIAEERTDSSMDYGIDSSQSLYQTESSAASAAGSDTAYEDSTDSKSDGKNTASNAGSAAQDTPKKNSSTEKLIYTYAYNVETKTFDSFIKKITEKTNQLGGYIENSETNGSSSDNINRYADITLRIPADQMDQLLSVINTEANVTYSNSSVDNVTLQYVDMQSHIKALRTEQKTLLELIEKANKLDDVIALQSQLTQVRYEIESYESQIRTYDNLISYSTLNLSIHEVERTSAITSAKTGFVEEVKIKFSDSLYAVSQWLRSLAIWLIGSLPILLPAVVAAVVIIALVRKWWKHMQKRRSVSNKLTPAAPNGYRSIYQDEKTEPQSSDSSDSES